MQGNTHRVGGMLCALAGYSLLESKGLLIGNVSPILQLTVMYPFAIYGSTFPDLDHHADSAPSKDIVSVVVNRVLHLTSGIRKSTGKSNPVLQIFDAQHRSWQTHSDLFLLICIALSMWLVNGSSTDANGIILKLVAIGFILGVISHMILDMLTPQGIWSVVMVAISKITGLKKLPQKISIVPKWKFFSTGSRWEDLIRYLMWVVSFILLARILYLMSPYRINFSL